MVKGDMRRTLIGCVLLAALSTACSSSSSSTTPTPDSPLPKLALSAFTVAVENSGAGLLYRTSYQVAETSGRANALINMVTFSFANNFITNASPAAPARLAAGTTLVSGIINISDGASATAGTTSVTLTIGYTDELGRSGTVSSTAPVTR
jgi:hypothetical protein